MKNFSCRLSDILQFDDADVSDSRPRQQDPILVCRQESVIQRFLFPLSKMILAPYDRLFVSKQVMAKYLTDTSEI